MAQGAQALSEPFQRDHKVLITYFTAGVPDLKTTEDAIELAHREGADIIELGVPYSEPVADGPTLQRATEIALKQGVTLSRIFGLVERLTHRHPDLNLVLMGYAQPFRYYGIEEAARRTVATGARGWILADVPYEEARPFWEPLDRAGGTLIPLVAPTTPPRRAETIARELAPPFLYYVSVTGVTGARSAFPHGWEEPLLEFRKVTKKPIVVGFGISGPELAQVATKEADGIVIGSALMAPLIEDGKKGLEKVERLIRAIRRVLP